MKALAWSALAVVAGLIVGVGVISIVEFASRVVYPSAAGVDASNPDALREFAARLPLGAFVTVLFAWSGGALAGAVTTARLARTARLKHAMIVGGAIFAAAVANMLAIPHPIWMWVAAVVLLPVCTYAGAWLGSGAANSSPSPPV